MREWHLTSKDPITLILASDARVGKTDYTNDHIWELSLGGSGEPPGLSVETTFGLRARTFRIFPRFIQGEVILTNPEEFACAPVVHLIYPNLIELYFSPFPEIDVIAEFWVPEPYTLACRYRIENCSNQSRQISVEIIGQLTPTEGQRLSPREIQAAWVLSGQTANIFPLIFLTGGPQTGTGSYPSLVHNLELPAGESTQLIWTFAACTDLEGSFTLARKTAARKWDAERAFIDLLNAGQVEIYTGNPDWDAALMLAQRIAYNLLIGPTEHLPYQSFVLNRLPEQGFSLRGDGSDYNHLWNGQPALEAFYLAGFLLPGEIKYMQGILRNFLATQDENGFVDWKPGLAGQKSHILATPILASLAWRIYQTSRDKNFLIDVFPGLLKFIRVWFTPAHDRDADGVPEWDHPSQAGSEDHPLYSRWQLWSRGIDISTAESPALCAFLYQECQSLIQMAEILGEKSCILELNTISERMRLAIEIAWYPDLSSYKDVDRDTHFSTVGEVLGELNGPGRISINRIFEQPVRLLFQIINPDGKNGKTEFVIHGTSATGQPRLERIPEDKVKWVLGRGIFTGERVYQGLEQVEILNAQPSDQITIKTAGYDDIEQTALLPLWAGVPDKSRAETLIENTITNPVRFWRPAGLPACPDSPMEEEAYICQSVNVVWNSFIGEGLVRYGHRQAAAELVNRIMKDVIASLKKDKAFRHYYHAQTGVGSGEDNPLQGLAPVNLFLETLGVKVISPERVILTGFNPFPWPVTVKYRGLTILKQKDKSTVIFPNGQDVVIDDPAPRLVALEVG